MPRIEITQDLVKELFTYKDGDLYWNKRTAIRTIIGARVGSTDAQGYRTVNVLGQAKKVHRLIYLYHHGTLPEFVDHIDGDKLNNHIGNLRSVTRAQNQWNRKTNANSSTGVKNVRWVEQIKRFRVYICRKYVGQFLTLEEAEQAAIQARKKLHDIYAKHK